MDLFFNNIMTFPFFNLPILLQWKILRQYVSLTEKIHVLSTIPEFSNLLESQESWPSLSKEKLEFLEWMRLLKPGLYFDPEIPDYKIQISFNEINLTLSICYLSHRYGMIKQQQQLCRTRSFSQVLQFLTQLKNRLSLASNIISYYNKILGVIIIDHNLNVLYRYGEIHQLENNECILEFEPTLEKTDSFQDENYFLKVVLYPEFKLKSLNNKVIIEHVKYPCIKYTFLPIDEFKEYKNDNHIKTCITFIANNEVKIQIQDYFGRDGYITWLIKEYLKIYPSWMKIFH